MDAAKSNCYLLVSGSPRSGTTFLANVLNTHPHVACLHEYRLDDLIQKIGSFKKIDDDIALNIVPRQSPTLKIDGSLHEFLYSRLEVVTEKTGDALLTYRECHFQDMYEAFFKCISGKPDLIVFGDKLPDLSFLKSNILDVEKKLGALKRLFIVRKPEDVIRSSLRRTMMATRGLDPLWVPRTIQEAILEWVENWEYIAAEARRSPRDVHVMKYEDLVTNFAEESRMLASFLGVSNNFEDISASLPEHLIDFELSPQQASEIKDHLGGLSTNWDSFPLPVMIAAARRTVFYCGATRLFEIAGNQATRIILRRGFSDVEDFGVWTCEEVAEIEMRLDGPVSSVQLSVRPFFKTATFTISSNGAPEKEFYIRAGFLRRYTDISIPVAPNSSKVKLVITMSKFKSSADPPYTEFRKLGIGLRRLSLESI